MADKQRKCPPSMTLTSPIIMLMDYLAFKVMITKPSGKLHDVATIHKLITKLSESTFSSKQNKSYFIVFAVNQLHNDIE